MRDVHVLLAVAACSVVLHAIAAGQYGFHRDELATLDDARHLAWGYVAYPPVTPLFARLSLELFGTSLIGFRLFASLAQATVLVLTGLTARELGGCRSAQIMAALAATPFALGSGALMQYVSFDCLWWVLLAYLVVRLVKSEDPRWWLVIGATIGVGMMTKYTMGLLALAVAAGTVLTPLRSHLRSKWLWIGVLLSVVIFIPNIFWQTQHDFVSLDFLKHIHERDVRIGRTKDFLPDQLKLTLFAFPIFLVGLLTAFKKLGGKYQIIGWMYLIPLLLFMLAQGRGYYLAGAYPVLYAMGSKTLEDWLDRLATAPRLLLRSVAVILLSFNIALAFAVTMPIAAVNSAWWRFAARNNGDLAEEIGWPELTAEVARIRDTLPADQQQGVAVLAGNYGEAGAINLYGRKYGLPRAISGTNSFWWHGYGSPEPRTVILLGFSQRFREANFDSCRLAGHTPNPYSIENEETRFNPDIFVCTGLKQSWLEFWKGFQRFG